MRLLAWPRKPEQDEIVARENGVGDLRQNGFFVAVHAGEERLARFEFAQQVRAHLFLYGAAGGGCVRHSGAPFAKCGWSSCFCGSGFRCH